jgi:hypothetical protein
MELLMRNYRYVYRLCGIKVTPGHYRRFGRFVPEFMRSVKSVAEGPQNLGGWKDMP